MSATIARASGPSTAEAPPNTAESALDGAETAPEVSAGEVEVTKEIEAKEEVAVQPGAAPAVDMEEVEHRHKALAIARIRLSSAPAGLKERMLKVAEEAKDAGTVEACLKAAEESLPDFLSENREEAARSEHPAGEVFFRGNAEEISDEQAEEIAQRQLARSGLLRGQRVRVAG